MLKVFSFRIKLGYNSSDESFDPFTVLKVLDFSRRSLNLFDLDLKNVLIESFKVFHCSVIKVLTARAVSLIILSR